MAKIISKLQMASDEDIASFKKEVAPIIEALTNLFGRVKPGVCVSDINKYRNLINNLTQEIYRLGGFIRTEYNEKYAPKDYTKI